MKTLLAALVLLLATSLCSAQQSNIVLGATVTVPGNVNYTINYLGGASLNIRLSQDAEVTLSTYVNVQWDLPQGFQSLSFGAEIGFQLSVSPSTAVVDVSLTTPALTVATAALLTGSVSAGCLHFDPAANFYSYIKVPEYNLLQRTITIPLPGAGIYLFVAVHGSATLPSFFNEPREVDANAELRLFFPGGLGLNLTVDADATVDVIRKDEPSKEVDISGHVSVGAFFEFNLDSADSDASLDASLSFQYNQSFIDELGVDESSLRFAFLNEVSGKWETPSSGGSVDVTNNIVIQQTNHFSEWAVVASPAAALQVSVLALLALVLALLL